MIIHLENMHKSRFTSLSNTFICVLDDSAMMEIALALSLQNQSNENGAGDEVYEDLPMDEGGNEEIEEELTMDQGKASSR